MPELGREVRAEEIGKKGADKYIWTRCPICDKERDVAKHTLKYQITKGLCNDCRLKGDSFRHGSAQYT